MQLGKMSCFLACLVLLGSSPAKQPLSSESLYVEERPAMGTRFQILLYAAHRSAATELLELAFEEIERVEANLSNYRDSSELSRINRKAAHEPIVTDPETFGLIERAIAHSRSTGGAFDITVGRLIKAWGFFRGRGSYPSFEELEQARAQTGWEHVALDRGARRIGFLRPDIELDLGAIGKGYALDRAGAVLRAQGVRAALLGAGQSTFLAIGSPNGGGGWPVQMRTLTETGSQPKSLRLRDQALSTSGSYGKFFELDDTRYGHILDPRTGHPVQGMVQVTVLAPRAELSDVLSTSLFVMGAHQGKKLLDQYLEAAALLVTGTVDEMEAVAINWPVERLHYLSLSQYQDGT